MNQWPPLRQIQVSDLRNDLPTQRIQTDDDVLYWKTTRGYHDLNLFLRRLNESVVGHYLPRTELTLSQASDKDCDTFALHLNLSIIQSIQSIIDLLNKLNRLVDEIPPLPTPQRFGNLAFRSWGKRLEEVNSWTSSLCCVDLEAHFETSEVLLIPRRTSAAGATFVHPVSSAISTDVIRFVH